MRLVIAVIGLFIAVSARAQTLPFDWRPLNRDIAALLRAGNYDLAAANIETALTACPRAADPTEVALCTAIFTENRAGVLEHRGDLAAAEADLKTCLATRQKALSPSDPLIGQAHAWLGLFYERHARPAEEIEELLAAEAIARAGGPKYHSVAIGLTAKRARALLALGRPTQALPLYQDTYAASRDRYGPNSKESLIALNNLVGALVASGFADAAIRLAETTLASPDIAAFDPTQRGRLAGQLAQQVVYPSQYPNALTKAEAALSALDNGTAGDPDSTVTLLLGLAHMNTKLGQPDRAVALARRAQALSAATWGKASFAVSDSLRREAEAEAARHDFTTAIDRLNEAAAMLTAPSVLLARAQLEVDRGGYLLRARRRNEATAGHLALADSPALARAGPVTRATVLELLGENLLRFEAFDAAGKLCEQSVSTVVSLTDQAILNARAHLCLGTAQLRQQHAADALVTADQAHTALWSAMVRQTGVEPPLPLQQLILQLKAHALVDTGRGNEALVVLQESVDLARRIGDAGAEADTWADIAVQQRKMRLYADASISSSNGLAVLGPDGNPLRRANLLENQALIAVALGRPADALPLYPQVLALRRAGPDPEFFAVASTERDFAAALSTAGRNQEAVGHADAAIELSRGLGPARRDFLIAALAWRVSLATSLGELQKADAITRELLTLLDPGTTDAAQTRLLLASLMDGQARRAEAEALRAETVAAMTAHFGAASAEVMRTRLAGLSWLRASGRMVEAEATVRDCMASAATTADLMLPCLLAAAETALDAGAFRDAAGHSAHAVSEIETHWEQNGASLLTALNLQARTTAALGDVGGLIRLYDRIHDVASRQRLNPTWIDLEYTQLLIQAGEAKAALPALRRVLEDAGKANDSALVMTATATLAEQMIATGASQDAIALWTPFPSTDAVPSSRMVMLQELGAAQFSLARDRDAAASLDQAAILVRSLFGPGNPSYAQLIAQRSAALARSGQSAKAEAAIRLLDSDTSRFVALVRTRALMRIAEEANDSVAAIQHARDALQQVRVVSGQASVAEAYARLDLAEELMAWNNHADQNDVEDAIAVIIAQQPGWRAECRVLRIRAMIAKQSGRFDSADAMLTAIETLLAAHEGDGSQSLASVRADRAASRLEAGDAKAADRLFRQAMDMATAHTGGHSALWARIAFGAATAAERTGDIRRAEQLRRDATEQLPSSTTRQTYRWL